jgi:hypothetical protein
MLNFESKFLNKKKICYEFSKLLIVDHLYWPIGSYLEWTRNIL